MSKFIITGGRPLRGKINVSGAKNAALPIIAATLLTRKPCTITNVPRIGDVLVMLRILEKLGAQVEFKNHTLKICTRNVKSYKPDIKLVGQLRASIVLLGALLARFGKAQIHYPGGCLIGARPLDTHLQAFKDLGAKIRSQGKIYYFELKHPRKKKIILAEMSVTATENILLACATSSDKNEIRLAACEPEIENLIDFLKKMGVKIKGKGTHNLEITGSSSLKSANIKIIPDRIEAATLVILGAATKSQIEIGNVNLDHLDMFLNKAKEVGINLQTRKNSIIIKPSQKFNPVKIRTDVYPGFATDFQAPFAVLLTQAKGKSIIFETLFENRFGYIGELVKMGAKAKLNDLHRVEIYGPTKLRGTKINSLDLRAGATLVIAALCAQGTSEINNVEVIDRGYEALDKRLSKLGAKIKRV